ncbi:MAG: hypothetical protein LBL37_07965 [Gracilibacteraceae bacterium]|nr:hypothetical protein [Gracilibacteraceae bacterium]
MALGQPKRRGRLNSLMALVRRHGMWRVILPLALIPVLAVVLFLNLSQQAPGGEKENIPVLAAASGNENVVEILPQTERDAETPLPGAEGEAALTGEAETESALINTGDRLYPTKDPFADAELTNVTFVGALLSGDGSGVAMLRADSTSYIVRTSDFVGKSAWQVVALAVDSVTLKNGAMTRVLYMTKPDLTDIIK